MNATILLAGYLTRDRLNEVWREIERYERLKKTGKMHLVLVIASEGGEASETIELIEQIERVGIRTSAKIYRAESAAALIALSAHEREMVRNGVFTITLGSAEIDSGTLITPEKVPPHIIEEAKKFRKKVFERLEHLGVPKDGPLMSKLLTQNHLTLTALECLRLGIINKIV